MKKPVVLTINGAVDKTITHRGLVNNSWFGIIKFKSLIRAVAINAVSQIMMKRYDVIHQSERKLLDVGLTPLTTEKLRPGGEKIIKRDNIRINMTQLHFGNNSSSKPPPTRFLPVVESLKSCYLLWHQFYQIVPKTHRYSLGLKIDNLFVEAIEAVVSAVFLPKESKRPCVQLSIKKLDTLKVLLMILWEAGSLEDKQYITLSLPLEEVGRQLGGWNGQLAKSLAKT